MNKTLDTKLIQAAIDMLEYQYEDKLQTIEKRLFKVEQIVSKLTVQTVGKLTEELKINNK